MVTSRFSHQPEQQVTIRGNYGDGLNVGNKPIKVKDIYSRGYGRSANYYWNDPDSPDMTCEMPGMDPEDMGYPND